MSVIMKDQVNEMLSGIGLTVQEISEQETVQKVKVETERGLISILGFVKDTFLGVGLGILLTLYMTLIVPSKNIYQSYKVRERGLQKHSIKL